MTDVPSSAIRKKHKRAVYCFPEPPTTDEKRSHEDFELVCRGDAVTQVKADLRAAVDLIGELFSPKYVEELHESNDLYRRNVMEVADRVRDERIRIKKQRCAASVAAGSM